MAQKQIDERVNKAILSGKTALLAHECEKLEIEVCSTLETS
jgi:hypothetical protein